jgi:TPR repeat protein
MRNALIIVGLLVVIAIGVRLSLPNIDVAQSPGEEVAVAATRVAGPAAAGDTPTAAAVARSNSGPASPEIGVSFEEESDLSPLEAEEARFTAMLGAILSRMQFTGENPDLTVLIAELEQMWDGGEPAAGLVISVLMNNPDFGFYDPANAQLWLERAADGGSLMAGTMFAISLLEGDPSQPGYDPARAVTLLEQLLHQGVVDIAPTLLNVHAGSQAEHGYYGDPGRVDPLVETIRESGDGSAQMQLAGMYLDGFGGPDQRLLAVEAYALAGDNGTDSGYSLAASVQLDCGENPAHDAQSAIDLLLRQIATYGETVNTLRLLANAFAQSGQWAEAATAQQRAIQLFRDENGVEDNSQLPVLEAELASYQAFELTTFRDCV